jgi:hypothetical protein
MFILAALADPTSGHIQPPILVLSMLGALPLGIVGVFYAEFKLRNRSQRNSLRPLDQGSGAKPQRAGESSISGKW